MPIPRSRHLLTVVHSGERTGPPLLALQFLRWLHRERPDWLLTTLFIDRGGPLVDDFAELGQTFVNAREERPGTAKHPWLASQVRGRRIRHSLKKLPPIDLAHIHCVGSMRALSLIPPAPVLCHVHELSVGQDFHLQPVTRREVSKASRYVAVSDAVRNELLANFPLDPSLVDRQWGFVDDGRLAALTAQQDQIGSSGEVAVVSSGVRNWRKAPELFVRTAILCQQIYPDIQWRFRWIGGEDSGDLDSKIRQLDLGDLIEFVGHQPEPLRWMAEADIFLSTAREDAFPLVAVEAAAVGRPIVSFDSGGIPELIAHADCGIVAPFPDVTSICEALATLATDASLRGTLGESGRRFAQENLVLSVAGPELLATIERTMTTG